MALSDVPTFLYGSSRGGSRSRKLNLNDIGSGSLEDSLTFYYDDLSAPLKSTQQLNVDWSTFDRHTFFSSAAANVNIAFDKLINGYPFDGTQREREEFLANLTGFEKYVFDSFPKFRGQLHFSGTARGESTGGTQIILNDFAGGLYPELSKNKTGESLLDPGGNEMSIELLLSIPPSITIDKQTVLQKGNSSSGFALLLTGTNGTATGTFVVYSSSVALTASAILDRGAFNHICLTYHNQSPLRYVSFYKDAELVSQSDPAAVGNLSISTTQFVIGSGSSINVAQFGYTPEQTLSGTIDELRVFHSIRTPQQQKLYAQKSIFATDDLKLYYRFNEPTGSVDGDGASLENVVLDSSGNSLHSTISNYASTLRADITQDATSMMVYEKASTSPVLFPNHPGVVALNNALLTSASLYDDKNPNLITRLIPSHYMLEGEAYDALESENGELVDGTYTGESIPGSGRLGSAQLMATLLYTWAKLFDDIKLYADHFSNTQYVDYESNETVPDNFLLRLLRSFGFNFPRNFFIDSQLEQYVDGENIDFTVSNEEFVLRYVQAQMMRRVIIEMGNIIRSKGTRGSIRTFLRALGIDPDTNVRIMEAGGPTSRNLSYVRHDRNEAYPMLQFVSGALVESSYLTGSRVEPGVPKPAGTANDKLFTSGSWMVEGVIKYPPFTINTFTESVCRLHTLSVGVSVTEYMLANLLVTKNSVTSSDAKFTLYSSSGAAVGQPVLQLDLTVPQFFDGDKWAFCCGRFRNDEIGSNVSSSYFLRVGRIGQEQLPLYYATSSYFVEAYSPAVDAFSVLDTRPGNFLSIGSKYVSPQTQFLNNVPVARDTTTFTGRMLNLRMWSKAFDETEWLEHVRNPYTVGVYDPLVNYDFVTTRSGSFGKLRLQTMIKQDDRTSDTGGGIRLYDFSSGSLIVTGSGFPTSSIIFKNEFFTFSQLSPYFDEPIADIKVRSRGFNDDDLVAANSWSSYAPVHEMPASETPFEDTRFYVDITLIDALNRDMIKMFSTYRSLDDALGKPELLFAQTYPGIDQMREIYFNNLVDKLNFKAFFEFYRWLDVTALDFLRQLLPSRTRFKGVNFTIESHMLERHKYEHKSSDIYVEESSRQTGTLRRIIGIDGTLDK